jgi:hypothetical protein
MSTDADALLARERELTSVLAERRSELDRLAAEIARAEASLPDLRMRAELALRRETEAKRKDYGTPAKVLITACVAPIGLLLGVVSGLFAWTFVAIPALALDIDPSVPLMALPALLACLGLVGLVYALIKIWA